MWDSEGSHILDTKGTPAYDQSDANRIQIGAADYPIYRQKQWVRVPYEENCETKYRIFGPIIITAYTNGPRPRGGDGAVDFR